MTFPDSCFDFGEFSAFDLPETTVWPVDLYEPPTPVPSSPIGATAPSPPLLLPRMRPRRLPVRFLPFVSLANVDDVVAHLNQYVNP
jgi:hypothetical protein